MEIFFVDKIGGKKLDKPIPMTMAERWSKKTKNCESCGCDIDEGDTYLYDKSLKNFYCVACVDGFGDHDALLKAQLKKMRREGEEIECDLCDGAEVIETACPDCGGNPDEYYNPYEPSCPSCQGTGTIEINCPYCNEYD